MASFIKNLFTPKWQHSDPQVRLSALDSSTEKHILARLAKEDSNEEVRLKAIKHLDDPEILLSLFTQKSDAINQASIEKYLTISLKSNDPDARLENIKSIQDAHFLTTIANYANNEVLAQTAIKQIKDENSLIDFIKQSPTAKSRALAAELVESKAHLKALEQHFLNKDKTLVRLAKNKLAKIAELETKQQAIHAALEKHLSDAEALSKHAFNPNYAGQLTLLKQSWELLNPNQEQAQLFEGFIEQCEKTLSDHQVLQAKQDEDKAAQVKAQELQLEALEVLKTFSLHSKSACPTLNETNQIIDHVKNQWKEASSLNQSVESQIKKEFDALIKPIINLQNSLAKLDESAITFRPIQASLENKNMPELSRHKKQISSLIKAINWPNEFPHNRALNSITTLYNEIDNALLHLKKDEKQVINQINNALKDLENYIEAGKVKPAKQLQNNIRKQLDQVDSSDVSSLKNQFQLLNNSLSELKDWQGFATLPKFEALCQSMNDLIDDEMPPKEKAKAIQALQEEWKSLGSLPNQKQQQALWVQFKQASDKAYEPCQAHYEEMSKLREYNLEQRTIICEQLEQYFEVNDWKTPNWKSVQQILDKAHDEFKKFTPVDHTVKKAVSQRFHDATQKIHGKLVDHFNENAASKQALIDQVNKLIDTEDLQQAIETCKELQNQWKTLGNAGRAERQLWSKFRQQCDALFEKRNAASQARKQYFDDNISKANDMLTALQSQVQSNPSQAKSEVAEVLSAIAELELPKKVQLGIEKRISDLQQTLESSLKENKLKAQHARWLNAQSIAQQIGHAEQNGQAPEEVKQDINSADIPANVKAIFERRLNQQSTSEDDLKKLCLELEILLDAKSPEEDQSQRMTLQVERLQKNMGQKLPTIEEQLRELQCRWFAVQAQQEDYQTLHDRFFSTLNSRYEAQA